MNLFQAGGLTILGVLLLASGREALRRYRPGAWGWVVLLGAGMVFLAEPELTRRLAVAVGIHRGADLMLYTAVLAGLVGFFLVYRRFRRMERQLTLVVRELALRPAAKPGDPAPGDDAGSE